MYWLNLMEYNKPQLLGAWNRKDLPNYLEPEDIYQAVCEEYLGCQPEGVGLGYIVRTGFHHIQDAIRRERGEQMINGEYVPRQFNSVDDETFYGWFGEVVSFEEGSQAKLYLSKLLPALSDDIKDILSMYYVMGYTLIEISQQTSIPVSTLQVKIQTALNFLKGQAECLS